MPCGGLAGSSLLVRDTLGTLEGPGNYKSDEAGRQGGYQGKESKETHSEQKDVSMAEWRRLVSCGCT